MTRTQLWGLVLPGLLLAAPAVRGEEKVRPAVVVQVRPLADLVATAKEFGRKSAAPQLGERAGPQTAREIEGALAHVLGKDWREAIDESKPLGLYATVEANGLPVSVLLVPVKDQKAFLALLAGKGIDVKEGEGGWRSAPLPGLPWPTRLRFASGYAYAVLSKGDPPAADQLLAPGEVLKAGQQSALAVNVYLDRVPGEARQIYAAILKESARRAGGKGAGKEPASAEKAGQEAGRLLVLRAMGWIQMAVQDGKALSLRLDLDPRTGELSLDSNLTARSDSDLAEKINGLRPAPGVGAGLLGGDAAASALVKLPVPEDVGRLFWGIFRQGFGPAKEAEERMLAAVAPTVKAGLVDGAAVLRGPTKGGRYTAVAGLRLKDALAVEQALRDLVKSMPEKEKAGVRMDAASIGPTKVHRFPLGEMLPPPVKQVFGEGDLVVAFRKDAVFAAYGEGAMGELREALASRPRPAPVVDVRAVGDPEKLADLVTSFDKKNEARVRAYFHSLGKRARLLDVSVTGGESLRLRAAVNLLLLPRAAAGGEARSPGPRKGR